MADNNEEALVPGPDGTLVKRELGVDTGVENYETYEQAVDALIEQKESVERAVIEVNWNIGRQAFLVAQGAKYGDHGIEEFAKDMDMSMSSVYTARNLYVKYTIEDVHRLCEANISYRKVTMLMACNDEAERDKIEGALSDYRINEDALKRMVNAANDGVVMPTDPSGMRAYVDMCKEGKQTVEEPEEDDDDSEADAETETPAGDPVEKLFENMRHSIDELSLSCSSLTQQVDQFSNIINGEQWGSLDETAKAGMAGALGGLHKELSAVTNKAFRLMRSLPAPASKEADK